MSRPAKPDGHPQSPVHLAAPRTHRAKRTILLVEPSAELHDIITRSLARSFKVVSTVHVREARDHFRRNNHDAFIISVSFTQSDLIGLQLIQDLRAEGNSRPVIALSDLRDAQIPTRCYMAGADGFIAKPIKHLAEIGALLTRLFSRADTTSRPQARVDGRPWPPPTFHFAGATFHPSTLTLSFPDGRGHKLLPKEVSLLHYLATHAGSIVPRYELTTSIWGPAAATRSKTLDTYLHRLRTIYRRHRVDLGKLVRAKRNVGWEISKRAIRTS